MDSNARGWTGCLLVLAILLAYFVAFPLLTRNEGPIKPRRLLPPGLCSGVLITVASLKGNAASGTVAIDLSNGKLLYHNQFLRYSPIVDPQGEWILTVRDGEWTVITSEGAKPLRPTGVTPQQLRMIRSAVRSDGVTASIVPLRLLETENWRGSWSKSEPHVLTLLDPPTGKATTRRVASGPGMEWCFSNREGEIITEWPHGEVWHTVNGRRLKRPGTGIFRQDLDTGKRTFIVEGRYPLMAADGRLAYVSDEGKAISIRHPDGTTTSYLPPRRWARPLQWVEGDRFLLWSYNNSRLSILDGWLGVRCKLPLLFVVGVMEVSTGRHYRILPNRDVGYGKIRMQWIEKLSPEVTAQIDKEYWWR